LGTCGREFPGRTRGVFSPSCIWDIKKLTVLIDKSLRKDFFGNRKFIMATKKKGTTQTQRQVAALAGVKRVMIEFKPPQPETLSLGLIEGRL